MRRRIWTGMMMTKEWQKILSVIFCITLCAGPGLAGAPQKGPITQLPIPRYVSLKTSEGNVRRGPSLSHRIDWILKLRNMPLQVVAEHGHWRKVLDFEGAGGWIHYSLLSGGRTVMIVQDHVDLRNQPTAEALTTARLERNVLARLLSCKPDWCRLSSAGYKGWAPKTALWGVTETEIFD
jgi:SH3-like domain-containing protein